MNRNTNASLAGTPKNMNPFGQRNHN